MYVTVFEGSKEDNLNIDKEAFDIWSKIVDSSKIILGNKKDNFWEMGDSGPCGPCSEIHIDLRSEEEKRKVKAIDVVNKDHPQVIELWNSFLFNSIENQMENLKFFLKNILIQALKGW